MRALRDARLGRGYGTGFAFNDVHEDVSVVNGEHQRMRWGEQGVS
jgi:hypothetical protein